MFYFILLNLILIFSPFVSADELILDGTAPFKLLEQAIIKDDVNQTHNILLNRFSANVNAQNASGVTVLHLAAVHGAKRVATYLLNSNANVSAEMVFTREQPIHTATWHHQPEIVRILLEHGSFANVRQRLISSVDGAGRTALCIAAQIGNIQVARYLLQANDRPQKEAIFDETSCPFGTPQRIGTCLHVAVIHNQATFVDFLLTTARKKLLKLIDTAKSTPLHIAAYREFQIFKLHQRVGTYPVLHDSLSPNPGDNNEAGPALVISLFIGAMQDAPGDTIGSSLLAKGAEIEAVDEDGRTPFLVAVEAGAVLYARFLHNKGANVSAVDNFGFNAFHIASDTKTLAFLTELLTLKHMLHDINSKSSACPGCLVPGSLTPLQVAILEQKPIEVVRFLLHHNALVQPQNDLGETALHLAIKTNSSDALALLIEKPNAIELLALPDSMGKKPLQIAVEQGNIPMARILLGAIANSQSENDQHVSAISEFVEDLNSRSSLHEAVVRKNYHAFKMVFEKDEEDAISGDQQLAQLHEYIMHDDVSRVSEMMTSNFHDDVNVQNQTGFTPLHVAALYDAVHVGEYLIKRGANVTIANEDGELPIHMALWGNSYRFLDYMLRTMDLSGEGDNHLLEAEQNEGETPLFYAGKESPNSDEPDNRPDDWHPFAAAAKLLEHFAKIDHMNKRGMQPIHEAVVANQRDFAEFLVAHGAKLTAKCCPPDGKTAFHLAAEYDSASVFDGGLYEYLNETVVVDNYEHAPICIAANAGSINFARKLFEFSKRDGAIEEISQPCLYPPSYNLRDTGDPIHIAVSSNQNNFVNFLLEIGGPEEINSADSAGRSLLHVAALKECNYSETALTLINKGAELEVKDLHGRTPFLFAVERGAVKYAEFLSEHGADASAIDTNGYTAFHIANDAEMLKYLINLQKGGIQHTLNSKSHRCPEKPRPSEKCLTKGGLTPLHVAVLEGKSPAFISALLSYNPDEAATNDFGQTAFHLAVKLSANEALEVLLTNLTATSTLAIRDRNGDTPLHLAVRLSNFAAIKSIMQMRLENNHVANVLLSGDGLTPLHQAIASSNVKAVQLLLENGAKVTHLDAFGRSALRFAVRKGETDEELFHTVLLEAVNESAVDLGDQSSGDTALHRTTYLELGRLADLLLEQGASCSVVNRQGLTPLHIAVSDGFGDMAKRLLKYPSCDPLTLVDASGKSVLEDVRIRRFAPVFVEETILSQADTCPLLARKIQLALKIGSLHFAELLLKTLGESACGTNAAAINELNADGYSAFHTALIIGKLDAINWCILNGASITKRTSRGRSAINLALFGHLTEQVVQFVANVTQTLANEKAICVPAADYTLKAAASNRRDLVKLLVKNDALLLDNCVDGDNSNTPLHYLAALGDVIMAKEIVANGRINFDVNVVNKNGLTALHLSTLNGGPDAVDFTELLLDYGGDVSLASSFVTKEGDSTLLPLHIAASRCGNADTLNALVYHVIHQFERNSAVNFLLRVSTKLGKTTPQLAAKYHQVDLYMRMVEVFEYFRSWSKQTAKLLFLLPNIRAILPLPSGRDAVVVSYNGDVLGVTTDCEHVLWRSKVFPPKALLSDYQGIYHAALDSITKHIYFTFHHPHRDAGIFYTTLTKLTSASDDVVLDPLMQNGTTKDSQFLALYVDAERETILANDPWVNHNIAAYSLSDGRLLNRSTVHTPASVERFEPLFCSLSRPSPPVANTDQGPRLLAVSDHNHRIHLFKRKPDGRDSLETTFVATIAEQDQANPSRLGSVFYPADLTFDHLGNLFVADYLNRRLQIFAAADLLDGTSLRAVWATDKLRSEVQRIAVAVDKDFRATAMAGLESGHVLCFKSES